MPVHRDNLKDIVDAAWIEALENPDPDDHGKRSTQWVDALARQFQANYALERRHRVFWKGNEDNKGSIKLYGVKCGQPRRLNL